MTPTDPAGPTSPGDGVRSSVVSHSGARKLGGSRVITDLVAVLMAVAIALLADWGAGGSLPEDTSRQILGCAIPVVWMITLWQSESRQTSILAAGSEEYRRVISASLWMLVFVATFAYFTDSTRARSFVLGTAIVGTALILLFRLILRALLRRTMAAGHPLTRVYVMADPAQLTTLRAELARSRGRFAEVGHWTGDLEAPEPSRVVRSALAAGADTILFLPSTGTSPHWTRQLGWAMETTQLSLLVSPALVDVAGPRLRFEPVEGMTFISVDMPRFTGPERVVKRTMDLVGACVGLTVFALPMALIAIAIRLDTPGPAIFRQERQGIGDTTFTCLKFRTMFLDAEAQAADLRRTHVNTGATFKLADDPRVTRFGSFLRRTSLDELPQLWNVLRGEMSLVGPRPHQLSDVAGYDRISVRRLLSEPGLTGLWQVSGRSDTTWQENVELDLYYVENWSLSLDLVILLRTVGSVVRGRGAY